MTDPVAGLRALWRRLWHASQLDADMDEEMRFHIEMEEERLTREKGLSPAEARRQAHLAFGGLEHYKEAGRDVRGLRWLETWSLDFRLGVRMLVKYRGLTLVGGFAMAVAIALGATSFEVFSELLISDLPFEGGTRVVAIQYATSNPGDPERHVLHEFVSWREELESFEQLAAFRNARYNLLSDNAPPEPVRVAEVTASGFAVARTAPLLGRYLLPADERGGAPPVVVIGDDVWRSRFDGDPRVVGRTMNLDGVRHVVVGVMPPGFRFPVDHRVWIPLRVNPHAHARWRGPELYLFGRLARGVSIERAQAELTAVAQRGAATYPDPNARLRPVVIPYTREHLDLADPVLVWMLRVARLLIGALSFVVAVNLAILMYARTATRLGEIAVRTALGATRRRILGQLFIEALVLTMVGAAAGLLLTQAALERVQSLLRSSGGTIPFWMDFDVSVATVFYALGLAVVAALIMGVLPGMKATGRHFAATLHELNGRTGTRLGAMWTTLVVAQIAVAVFVLPVAVYLSWQLVRMEFAGSGFAAEDFVVSTVALGDPASSARPKGIRERQIELMSRLRAEPAVAAVTFSSSVPGFAPSRQIEFEAGASARTPGDLAVSTLDVDVDMFNIYRAKLLAGRGFHAGDLGAANTVVVNGTFQRTFLGTRSALGLRFRYSQSRSDREAERSRAEWYQIIGVVGDFPTFRPALGVDGEPVVYHAAAPGDIHPVVISVRFSGGVPDDVTGRFRTIAAEIDPALQLRRAEPLLTLYNELRSFWRTVGWGTGFVTASVLLLSAAGIYALTSFAVAQRRREIGIRAALGAAPHRLVLNIFGRAALQLSVGLLVGSLLSGTVFFRTGLTLARATGLLLAVAAIMFAVGLLAGVGPARRGLRIQPADVLKADM